jgi:hypothetical protein
MGPPRALHAIPQELIDTLYFLLPPTSKAGVTGLGTDIEALVMGLRSVCLLPTPESLVLVHLLAERGF